MGVGVGVKTTGVGSLLNKPAPPMMSSNAAGMSQINVH